MFNKVSRTGTGMYAFLAFSVLQLLGFDVTEEGVGQVVIAVGTVLSFFLALYGQWKRGDVEFGLFRKNEE